MFCKTLQKIDTKKTKYCSKELKQIKFKQIKDIVLFPIATH